MPQVKEPLLRTLVREALNEAELTVGPENSKFSIEILVSNTQSETKEGIRIRLRPKDGFLDPEQKKKISAAIMTKFNNSLEQFNLQISVDSDVPDPEVMGFYIPLEHIKNMIEVALGATSKEDSAPKAGGMGSPTPPSPPKRPVPGQRATPPSEDEDDELMENEDPLDRAARLAKQPLAGMGDMTGLGLKRSGYENEEGGKLSLKELYEHATNVKDGMLAMWVDIVNESDYKFKEYLENNEDQWVRTGAVASMVADELEDRLELEEPVGPDQGIEELKKVIKKLVKEQRIKTDKVISSEEEFATEYPELYQQAKDNYSGRPGDEGWEKWWTVFLPKGLIFNPYGDYYGFGGVIEGKKPINEVMRQKVLNEISGMVIKEDFYSFINAGNNIMRSLEERFDMRESKRYLEYLVKNNIM